MIINLDSVLKSLCVCLHHFYFLFLSASNFPLHTALQSELALQYTVKHSCFGDPSENKKSQYINQKVMSSSKSVVCNFVEDLKYLITGFCTVFCM